ncbi:hypothetical protein T552_02035 [Pneumocystis carinii B80]|uniref:Transcription regulator Rua1 C-terminal domain-containing protein n=1 Tax=Pneumocystis carinii (strain B80) TaxID=1408658 RepID=A0A0W4ZIG9_PNEC8|nr:hypothetical protein T552_02035 [Pneumocystis carinii B80]KTW28176.1 hypothetical protein T552_02035 [Pneumocystis carinii B80]
MNSEKDLSYAFRRNACDMFLTSTVNAFSSAYIPEKGRASIAVWQDDIVDGRIVDIKCIENIQSISSHLFNGSIINLNESSVSEGLPVLENSTRVDNFSIHEEEPLIISEGTGEGECMDKNWIDESRRRLISSSMNGRRRPLAALSTNTLAVKKKERYSSIALCETALQCEPVYTCNSSATILSITPSLTEFSQSIPVEHKTMVLNGENELNEEFSNTNMNSSMIEENTGQKRQDTLALSSIVLAQFRTKRISTLRATTLGKRVGQELTKLSNNFSCKRLFPNNKRTIVASRHFRRVRQKATEDEVDDILLKSEFSHSHIQNIYSAQKSIRPSYIYSKKIDFLDNNIVVKSESSSDSSHSSDFFSPISSRPTSPLSTQRTFPENIPIHPDFFRYYLAHPRFTYSNGNPPIQYDADDLYNPRYIKGIGINKMGMCPICCENIERGGQGKEVWLKMKISAFWYHMNFFHGINPTTALPYSPPVSFRTVPLVTINANGVSKKKKTSGFTSIPDRKEILEGKCHKCKKWVRVQGIKEQEVKVAEIFWWKHARSCHGTSRIKGEGCEMR